MDDEEQATLDALGISHPGGKSAPKSKPKAKNAKPQQLNGLLHSLNGHASL